MTNITNHNQISQPSSQQPSESLNMVPLAVDDSKFNFEQLLAALEKIVKQMESGALSLEDSIKYFEEGMALLNKCQSILKNAEQKVQILVGNGQNAELQQYSEKSKNTN